MPTTSTGITYDRGGDPARPAVLLLHAGVADRRMWDPQWSALAERHDVVRPDQRGFGGSVTPPDGPLDPVADVLAVLDDCGIESCHVVAASMGAGVATELALVAPDRAATLVLAPPGGSLLATMTPDLRAFIDAERTALAAEDLDAAVEANVSAWVVGRGRSASDVRASVLDVVRRMQRRAFEVSETFGDLDEHELQPPALERLGEIAVPVLVVVGAHDLETSLDAADRVVGGLPDGHRVDWPDVAHLPSLEQPERFAALVLEWVATH